MPGGEGAALVQGRYGTGAHAIGTLHPAWLSRPADVLKVLDPGVSGLTCAAGSIDGITARLQATALLRPNPMHWP